MRVAFHNLGCKVNAYETEKMIQSFREAGYDIGSFEEINDVYIVNTCTVTNIADRKSRQMLHRAKALNPQAVVVACGCFVETDRKGAEKDEAIDILAGNREKENLVSIVEDYLSVPGCRPDSGKTGILSSLHDHTRAYIKIQDGCEQYCSYCIIPFARGRLESRRCEDIIKELAALSRSGVKEAVLTGIHLSSYGIDLREGKKTSYNELARGGEYVNRELIEVIERASEIEGIERIRLGSLEPRIITDELLSVIRDRKKICPHFHLSLQSGSDSVLKRMNRHYDTAEFYEKMKLIRKYFEHPAITADVIAGFPGETIEEFNETVSFLNMADFYETHIFRFSGRHGTVAYDLPGQLTSAQKAERSAILSEIDKRKRAAFRSWYTGKKEGVLFEEPQVVNGIKGFVGFTKEYVKVFLPAEEDLTNRLIDVTITGDSIGDELVYGKI
jgi:threonylcarbamoyladenosine tRNA methylthiotransferase MtaB